MEIDNSSSDLSMVMFAGDKRLKKTTTEEEPTPEELDTKDWVPVSLIVEAHRLDDGMTTMMEEELRKRVVMGRATCRDNKTLQGKYNWIPEGWTMEIRTGREGKKNKMFKFFVHKSSGVRLSSKQDVLAFQEIVEEKKIPATRVPFEKDILIFEELVKERKVSRGTTDTDIECDTNSQDNIVAQLDFYTWRLSAGWVKETVFRKCRQGEKRDLYFTDPLGHLVFRTKKSAEQYFWTNKNREDGCLPTQSVRMKYYVNNCEDIPEESCLDSQHEPEEEKCETKYWRQGGNDLVAGWGASKQRRPRGIQRKI